MPIDAKDLRKGNLFLNKDGQIKEVLALSYEVIKILDENGCLYTDANPIPLTTDILECCGFEKSLLDISYPEEGYFYHRKLNDDKHCDLSLISGDKNGKLEICLFPYEDWFRYEYLHQIQNIFKDLTNEELPITNLNKTT